MKKSQEMNNKLIKWVDKNLKTLILCIIVLIGPIFFSLYTSYVQPRPYYIREMDLEPDYYYNSRMVHDGKTVPGIHHPGTPIYYLGSFLLGITGDSVDETQHFFNLAYLLVAIMTGTAMVIFIFLIVRQAPIGVSLLCLVSLFVWPPFLTFMNHFGSESFIVAFGLPTIAIFWKSLELRGTGQKRLLFICGLWVGLCLSTKMTFLPVAVAIGFACFFGTLMKDAKKSLRKEILSTELIFDAVGSLSLIIAGAVLSFATCTAPVLFRLPKLFYLTMSRPEAYPSGNIVIQFLEVYGYLLKANWLFALFIAVLLAVFFLTLVWSVCTKPTRNPSKLLHPIREEGYFDSITAALFLAVSTVGFFYCIPSSIGVVRGYEAGIGLRNISPSALFLPFMIVYIWKVFGCKGGLSGKGPRWLQVGMVLLALGLSVNGIGSHVARRNFFIEEQKRVMTAVERRVSELRSPNTRVAFWNGVSNDIIACEASFHFLGDMTYAFNHYDNELLHKFIDYTMFDIRFATHIERQPSAESKQMRTPEGSRVQSRYGFLGDFLWNLISCPDPYAKHYENFIGEGAIVPVSLIIFPEKELLNQLKKAQTQDSKGEATEEGLLWDIYEKTGFGQIWRERICGVEYVILRKGAI
jgi:hypothetical protein